MRKTQRKTQIFLAVTLLASLTILTACGGSGGGVGAGTGGGGSGGGAPQMISNVFDFVNNLIANNSENSDPIDINSLTLATDETSEPTPF